MFASVRTGRDGQPGRQQRAVDMVGMRGIARLGLDLERAGVEVGMPDNPRRARVALGAFGKSAVPSTGDPPPFGPTRKDLPASRRSPGHARRHRPGRAAAIPT
jgi:hypothetical protein